VPCQISPLASRVRFAPSLPTLHGHRRIYCGCSTLSFCAIFSATLEVTLSKARTLVEAHVITHADMSDAMPQSADRLAHHDGSPPVGEGGAGEGGGGDDRGGDAAHWRQPPHH